INNTETLSNLEVAHDIEANAKICDLTIAENETIQNFSEISESDESNETETYSTDEDNTFKAKKALGAGTQLVDAQDFQKFCSDYQKISVAKKNMEIYITINSQTSNKTKRKKKDNGSETEIDTSENNTTKVYKNKNKIPKISNLISKETQIAKNVLEIQTANH
ncbi:12209_t:CDS:2, partial [Gigaspora margarita]